MKLWRAMRPKSSCPDSWWHRPAWSPACFATQHEHDRCDACGHSVKYAGVHTPDGVWCWSCALNVYKRSENRHGWSIERTDYDSQRDAERWLRWRKDEQ